MALWTDVIDPATLTGFARESATNYEQSRGSLVSVLPDQTVNEINVRVVEGDNGLEEVAEYRAYDAEITGGGSRAGKRKTIELPPLGTSRPVSEYDQLIMRDAQDNEMLNAILNTTGNVVTAISDAMERMRGIVLATGKATIDQPTFKTEDDFGRDADMSVTPAGSLWTDPATADILDDLSTWVEAYQDKNHELPGTLLMPRRMGRLIAQGKDFQTLLQNGSSRPATVADVQAVLDSYDMPQIRFYDRHVLINGQREPVLPTDSVFLLPGETGPNRLGRSYWGRTLTSTQLAWALAAGDQAGIVTGVYQNEKPPAIAEVIGDAIGLPILWNANLAMRAKVA